VSWGIHFYSGEKKHDIGENSIMMKVIIYTFHVIELVVEVIK
jgi:hypothetical protein